MSDPKDHKIVFIVYITDVEAEVEACKEELKELNWEIESTNIYIDVKTFRDMPENFGNPQGQVNCELVNRCDVFIGVVGGKWALLRDKAIAALKKSLI